jgi:hypothetical protein
MPIQHIISPRSTPNSHRRQPTPRRRVITPQSHGMVRRSARQQNLSQDMMAETLAQANHCFSLSANATCCHSSKPKTPIMFLPEMANAVICPETGKSLKHQELITKLKYKIKWMRSTANEINRLYNTNTIRWIICCGYQGPQRVKRKNAINRWRRPDWISRRQINQDSRTYNSQNTNQ